MESRQERVARLQHRRKLEKELANGDITDMFQYMESRLTCPTSGKILQDVVIGAIQRLKSPEKVRSFYEGFVADITARPEKYPAVAKDDPAGYAQSDIGWALGLHFCDRKYHDRWEKAILD